MRLVRMPGLVAYVTLVLWLLLTALTPTQAAPGAEPTALRAADLTPIIEAALHEEGVPVGAEITIAAPDAAFAVEQGAIASIDSLTLNAATGRFVARVRLGANSVAAISGAALHRQQAPTLAKPIARGEIISESDIVWRTMASAPAGAVLDAEGMVGMAARRDLPAGAPIRAHDLEAPRLVKRGGLVTIVYVGDGIRLTHAGVALADGAEGEVVGVKNVKSERVVQAIVSGANVVEAVSARQTLSREL